MSFFLSAMYTCLQDGLEHASEVFLLVFKVVIEFQLNVEAQPGIDLLKCFPKRAKSVLCLHIPVHNSAIFHFAEQGLPTLHAAAKEKLITSKGQLASYVHNISNLLFGHTFPCSFCGPY
jgi:hypothetical protein